MNRRRFLNRLVAAAGLALLAPSKWLGSKSPTVAAIPRLLPKLTERQLWARTFEHWCGMPAGTFLGGEKLKVSFRGRALQPGELVNFLGGREQLHVVCDGSHPVITVLRDGTADQPIVIRNLNMAAGGQGCPFLAAPIPAFAI